MQLYDYFSWWRSRSRDEGLGHVMGTSASWRATSQPSFAPSSTHRLPYNNLNIFQASSCGLLNYLCPLMLHSSIHDLLQPHSKKCGIGVGPILCIWWPDVFAFPMYSRHRTYEVLRYKSVVGSCWYVVDVTHCRASDKHLDQSTFFERRLQF
jgi:hypothetical protein